MDAEQFACLHAEERFPLTETWEESAAYLKLPVQQLLHLALIQPTSLRVIDIPGKGAAPDKRASVLTLPGQVWGDTDLAKRFQGSCRNRFSVKVS